MNCALVSRLIPQLERHTTDQLIEILTLHDYERWSEEYFAAAKQILTQRGIDMPTLDRPSPRRAALAALSQPITYPARFAGEIPDGGKWADLNGNGRVTIGPDRIIAEGYGALTFRQSFLPTLIVLLFAVIPTVILYVVTGAALGSAMGICIMAAAIWFLYLSFNSLRGRSVNLQITTDRAIIVYDQTHKGFCIALGDDQWVRAEIDESAVSSDVSLGARLSALLEDRYTTAAFPRWSRDGRISLWLVIFGLTLAVGLAIFIPLLRRGSPDTSRGRWVLILCCTLMAFALPLALTMLQLRKVLRGPRVYRLEPRTSAPSTSST